MKNNDSKFNQKPVPLIDEGHRKNSNKLTKEWKKIMEKNPTTKKGVLKKRDELENKYFGNKGDNPNN